jgi:nickel-dependent lactate racemase
LAFSFNFLVFAGRGTVKVKLAYGKKGLYVDLPDSLNVEIVAPKYAQGLGDQAEAVRNALRQPIQARPLKELVSPSDTVAIVLNDITRPTPYNVILPVLLNELGHVPDDQVIVFIATGTHRRDTETELRDMLGAEILDRFRIIQNDARDRNLHTFVGTTSSGNDIWMHSQYVKCDMRILTGFIEPHFFAGFSGGGKACMPGLALLDTVLKNHSPQNIDHPMATWGITRGNPVWEEIREAALMVQPIFLLNVTLNRDKQITAVFAGDLQEAHAQGCAFVRKSAMVPVRQPYDIVITSNSGYPLDLNLYQSVKGMSAAAQVVKDAGTIIIAADCWDGIPQHGQYGRLLREAESPASLLEVIHRANLMRQDVWQAQIHARICQKADVYFYSENLSDEQIKSAWLKPCHSIEATVEQLLVKYGRDASICVLPEGPQTIPYIRKRSVT